MPRRTAVVAAATMIILALLPPGPARAETSIPAPVTNLFAVPGPEPGEIAFTWQSTGQHVDHFRLETAVTSFDPAEVSQGRRGRAARTFMISSTARSFLLTADQTAAAGAGLGTGNHLYVALVAVNEELGGPTAYTASPLQAVMPLGMGSAKATGTKVRAATFNVRAAKADSGKRSWLVRAPDVAREIVDHDLDVAALQELSPSGADGHKWRKGKHRQTTSLLATLARTGGSRYRLVRTTSYVKAGSKTGSQGARILYDSKRFELLSECPETTKGKTYNPSCTIRLPLLSGDSEDLRRRAAYAELRDRATKRKFFVVSAHLDARHSADLGQDARYNELRAAQVNAIVKAVAKANPKGRKVIFGGDINSWQVSRVGHAPHDALLANGFWDTASASKVIDISYGTSNQFATEMKPNVWGFGTRIDLVMIKGTTGANRFENVLEPVDEARPSDHNLVLADLVL